LVVWGGGGELQYSSPLSLFPWGEEEVLFWKNGGGFRGKGGGGSVVNKRKKCHFSAISKVLVFFFLRLGVLHLSVHLVHLLCR